MAKRFKYQEIPLIFTTAFFALAFSMPILVTVSNSFMTIFEIDNRYAFGLRPVNYFRTLEAMPNINFIDMTLIPAWVSLRQYSVLLIDTPSFYINFWNSVIITLPSVMGQLMVAVLAAYAFEFSRWHHKEKLFFVYIVIMLMPLPVILVPQFVMADFIGIHESVLAVVLPAVFSPFGVFLLRQFLKSMPLEYIEASKIDGAGHAIILFAIVVPLLKPAISALAILVFIDYWNVVEQAIIFIPDAARQPLSVALSTINPDIAFAASVVYMIPALLVFLYGQEYLVEGIQLSGIK